MRCGRLCREHALTLRLDDETPALIIALATVNGHIPRVVAMLSQGELPLAKQLEFGDLLTSVGELLIEHATWCARTRPDDRPQHEPAITGEPVANPSMKRPNPIYEGTRTCQ